MKNVEIKAKIEDITSILNNIKKITEGQPVILEQEDTYFVCHNGRLKFREIFGDHSELIFYNRDDIESPKVSHYHVLFNADNSLKIFLSHALGIRGVVRKKRMLFTVQHTRIHVDEVASLGNFLELEVVLQGKESHSSGLKRAHEILNVLDIPKSSLIATSYIDLLN